MPATHPDFDPDEHAPWEEHSGNGAPIGPHLTFQRAEAIEPTRPEWLWDRWLAKGAVHLGVGRQGTGKTTFASFVLGDLSQGRPLPGDVGRRDPVTCALLSLEESADRLVGRLHATGADVSKVLMGDVESIDPEGHASRRPWRLPQDCSVLENLLATQGVGFLVVDGLGYSIAGDSHNYAVIGPALSALAAAAERTSCAILGLTHPPKGASDPVTAAVGSTAWTAVARVVWLLGVHPEDESGALRVVRVSKSNFKMPECGLSFTIAEDERFETGYVTQLARSDVSAEDLAAASSPPGERSEREEARELVRSILRDGPMDTADLLKLTRAAGVSDRTVVRARQDVGVKASARHDPGTGKMLAWSLSLPEKTTVPTTVPASLRGPVGTVGTVAPNSSYSETQPVQSAQSAQETGQVAWFGDDR